MRQNTTSTYNPLSLFFEALYCLMQQITTWLEPASQTCKRLLVSWEESL